MAVKVYRPLLLEQRMHIRRKGRFVVEQQGGRRCLKAIVDSQANGFAFVAMPVAKNTGHEIIHTVRAVGPAEQRLPPLPDRAHRRAVAIDRDIHQGPGLDFSAGFLHQFDLAGQRRLAGVASLFHGGPPDRIGVHVETEGAQVAVAEGFEINNGRVEAALAGRAHGIVGESFAANLRDVGGKLIRGDGLGKADSLYAGDTSARPQCLDVGSPLFAIYRV